MKIKKWFKQVFRGWVPTEPLTTKHWLKNKIRLVGLSVVVVSVITFGVLSFFATPTILPPPIFTGKYNPGVKVGDYVTYGNFVCARHHPKSVLCIADLAFKKMEVTAVSGKEITFLHSEQFKNGTATWNNGRTEIWDVEKAVWSDDTPDYVDSTLIIAANLTQGDCIQSTPAPPDYHIVESGVRNYLGVSRNVSILRIPASIDINGNALTLFNLVYDQESGIRLEWALVTLDGEVLASMGVVETNVFSTSSTSLSSVQVDTAAAIPTVALYAATGSIIIAFLVGMGIIFRRKRARGGEENKKSSAI